MSIKIFLEEIYNSISLNKLENIQFLLERIRPYVFEYKIDGIIEVLEAQAFQSAQEKISIFLGQFNSLVCTEDLEIIELKLEFKNLELRLESIVNEKTDIERDLVLFNHRQFEILGEITEQILSIKAEYLHVKAEHVSHNKSAHEEVEELKKEAEDAKKNYEEYSGQYEEVQYKHVHVLEEEEALDLKKWYRKACNLCHPDKVSEENKEQAHSIFIELQEAYENNDLKRIQEIYELLRKGDFNQKRKVSLNTIEILRATILEMQSKVEQALKELTELRNDPVVLSMYQIGKDDKDWINYFQSKKEALENELEYWTSCLNEVKKEAVNG